MCWRRVCQHDYSLIALKVTKKLPQIQLRCGTEIQSAKGKKFYSFQNLLTYIKANRCQHTLMSHSVWITRPVWIRVVSVDCSTCIQLWRSHLDEERQMFLKFIQTTVIIGYPYSFIFRMGKWDILKHISNNISMFFLISYSNVNFQSHFKSKTND